jgi:hypothetical protein
MARRKHYHVYVVELSSDVLRNARFKRSNPGYQPGKPCVYVGMTGLDPDVRFDKRKADIQANRYVQKFGQRLKPKLYALYNPLTYDRSLQPSRKALPPVVMNTLAQRAKTIWMRIACSKFFLKMLKTFLAYTQIQTVAIFDIKISACMGIQPLVKFGLALYQIYDHAHTSSASTISLKRCQGSLR